MSKINAIIIRAIKTLIQSAIGAAATAALAAIGSATTIGQVNWGIVASTAGLAAIVSVLMNLKASLPETQIPDEMVLRDEDDRSDNAVVPDEEV